MALSYIVMTLHRIENTTRICHNVVSQLKMRKFIAI